MRGCLVARGRRRAGFAVGTSACGLVRILVPASPCLVIQVARLQVEEHSGMSAGPSSAHFGFRAFFADHTEDALLACDVTTALSGALLSVFDPPRWLSG